MAQPHTPYARSQSSSIGPGRPRTRAATPVASTASNSSGCAFDGRPESRSASRWAPSLTRRRDHALVVFLIRASFVRRSPAAIPVEVVWHEGDARLALAQRSWARNLLAPHRPAPAAVRRRFGGGSTALARSADCRSAWCPRAAALRPEADVQRTGHRSCVRRDPYGHIQPCDAGRARTVGTSSAGRRVARRLMWISGSAEGTGA
jgi:hypothetical protein